MLEHVPVLLRDLVVGLSGLGAGITLYLVAVHVVERRRWWWAWASARAGFAIVVVLVAESVFRRPELPFTWRVGFYIVGLMLAFVGYVGIAIQTRTERRQFGRRRDDG